MKDNSNISQELLETVERYHHNTMTKDERLSFEVQLQEDSEFKLLVDDIQSFLFGIEQQSLKEKLEEFHKDLPIQLETETIDTKVRFLQFRKIAAAAIIVMALGSYWFFNGSSNERLYTDYFLPDPGLPTTMSTSDNFAFYDAMVNYKRGDYKKAIGKWNVLQKRQPKNDTLNYFLGVAKLANKDEKEAIDYLESVTDDSQSQFRNEAYYYLGLAYLKSNELELAIKNFNSSSIEKGKEILSKLKD